eukprot:jgi/Botrbrau1/12075/Bobra.0186s0003.1
MVVIIRLTVFKGSTKTFNDHEGDRCAAAGPAGQVLASLERRSLRTARLVCRAFRAASIPCVTCLNYNCETQMMLGNLLLHSLRVFTCVVDLNLLGDAGSVAGVLREPGVLPRLRELRLSGEDEEDEGASGIADLVPLPAGGHSPHILGGFAVNPLIRRGCDPPGSRPGASAPLLPLSPPRCLRCRRRADQGGTPQAHSARLLLHQH